VTTLSSTLLEYESTPLRLTRHQAHRLATTGKVTVAIGAEPGEWLVTAQDHVGSLVVDDVQLLIRPKIKPENLFLMLEVGLPERAWTGRTPRCHRRRAGRPPRRWSPSTGRADRSPSTSRAPCPACNPPPTGCRGTRQCAGPIRPGFRRVPDMTYLLTPRHHTPAARRLQRPGTMPIRRRARQRGSPAQRHLGSGGSA
jgi:hypothetical protein